MRFIETTTHVSTTMLIEDWQDVVTLIRDIREDMIETGEIVERLSTLAECLSDAISTGTDPLRDGKQILWQPSPASLIAVGVHSGILVKDDGSDFLCAAGQPISSTYNSCCQCDESCMKKHGCNPELGTTVMMGGYVYKRNCGQDDEELIEAMEKEENKK